MRRGGPWLGSPNGSELQEVLYYEREVHLTEKIWVGSPASDWASSAHPYVSGDAATNQSADTWDSKRRARKGKRRRKKVMMKVAGDRQGGG